MDEGFEVDEISDAELAAEALAADPDAALPADAVPFSAHLRNADPLLPDWYMPSPMAGVSPQRRWRRRVSIGLVGSFVLINAAGLCVTYGSVVIA